MDFVIDKLDADDDGGGGGDADGDDDGLLDLEEKDGLLASRGASSSIEIASGGSGTGGGDGRGRTAASVPRDGGPAAGGGGGGRVGDAIRGVVRWGRGSRSTAAGAGGGGGAAGRGAPGQQEEEEPGLTTNLGTVAWAAPEMLLGGQGGRGEYTAKVSDAKGREEREFLCGCC